MRSKGQVEGLLYSSYLYVHSYNLNFCAAILTVYNDYYS